MNTDIPGYASVFHGHLHPLAAALGCQHPDIMLARDHLHDFPANGIFRHPLGMTGVCGEKDLHGAVAGSPGWISADRDFRPLRKIELHSPGLNLSMLSMRPCIAVLRPSLG